MVGIAVVVIEPPSDHPIHDELLLERLRGFPKMNQRSSSAEHVLVALPMPWRLHGERVRWLIEDEADAILFYDASRARKRDGRWIEDQPGREAHGFCDVLNNPGSLW